MNAWPTMWRLAIADIASERVLALCTVLSLAAVLAPLIVLAGLRVGVIEGLRNLLLADPHVREIVTVSNRDFDAGLLVALSSRPDVEFLAPRTRTLAASLLLEQLSSPGTGIRVDLVPSAPGDPLLEAAPTAADRIVLSAAAAARLHVTKGDHVLGRLARIREGSREAVPLSLIVQSVAPPAAFARDGAFVTLALAVFVEDFQDNRTNAPVGGLAALGKPDRKFFAGFRLYARKLDEVPALDADLRANGIDVLSRAGDIADLLRVDASLTLIFALVAALGVGGFLVSLGAGLWANVERKKVALALLRFMGLSSAALRLLPVVQALILSSTGGVLALTVALAAGGLLNHLFADLLQLNGGLCRITPGMAALALVATVTGSLITACAASTRAANLEPWSGVSAA